MALPTRRVARSRSQESTLRSIASLRAERASADSLDLSGGNASPDEEGQHEREAASSGDRSAGAIVGGATPHGERVEEV